MSELIDNRDERTNFNNQLLATASALALMGYIGSISVAKAEDDDRPTVWIELGTQLERATGDGHADTPPFFTHIDPAFTSPGAIADSLPITIGPEGKITFQPKNSDWTFSAGVRYGRSGSRRNVHQQGEPEHFHDISKYFTKGGQNFYSSFKCCASIPVTASKVELVDTQSNHRESHLVLDFQAGKDVGLGMFGKHGSSVVEAGVRFAQFTAKNDISVKARTDLEHYNQFLQPNFQYFLSRYPQKYRPIAHFHVYSLDAGSARSFHGIGPSLSWNASADISGRPETSELTFDWGVNGSLLFGRQKAATHHQSTGSVFYYGYDYRRPITHAGYATLYNHPRVDRARSRGVVVPNVGGMAGFSIRFPNAKVSMGYRADIFFGAMDVGWDARKTEDRSFYGPFATISIGLGG